MVRAFTSSVQSVPVRDAEGNLTGIRSAIVDITERKQAEEALQRYELLARHSRDIILFMRRGDGRILEANAAATRAYGYTHEELLARSIHDLRAPETQELTADQMAEADDQGMLFETFHRRKDGSTFPVEVSSQGATIGATRTLISVVRDITERRRAEEALLRAKEAWERTFASVPDLIAILDNQYQVLRVNEAMARRLGVKPEEAVGLRCYEVVHGLSEPPDYCPHSRTIKDGRQHIEEVHEDRLGGDFVVSTTPLHDDKGQMIGTVHVAHDITERKQMEEELRTSRDELELRVREKTADVLRLAAAVDKSAEAIVITDSSWLVQYANPAFYQLTGYRSDEVIGRDMTFLRSEKEDQSIYEMNRRAAIDGTPKPSRHVIKGKDGTIPVESLISSVRNDSGAITNFVFRLA